MANKNYQRLNDVWSPEIVSFNKEAVEIVLIGTNTKGTKVRVVARMDKYYLPRIVQQINDIAKTDATAAVKFLARIKEIVQ